MEHIPKHRARRLAGLFCVLIFLLALLPPLRLHAQAGGSILDPVVVDIGEGALTAEDGVTYLVTGTATAERVSPITVPRGAACTITLLGATLHGNEAGTASPILLEAGASLALHLEGQNELNGYGDAPAVLVSEGAELDIHGPGLLAVTAHGAGAGIGGRAGGPSGALCVYSGIIHAKSASGAGIGGGAGGSAGEITVSGGTITAESGFGGAGIGGGAGAASADILLFGGVITATGGSGSEICGGGAGVGGGSGGGSGRVYVYNARLTATGGSVAQGGGGAGAGIGGGGGNPAEAGAGGNGGNCAGADLFATDGVTIQATGGEVTEGDGGGGAGVGGGGSHGPGAIGGMGRSVATHSGGGGQIIATGGATPTRSEGSPGADFGDGGAGNSGGALAKPVKPSALPVPEEAGITSLYLNGIRCEMIDGALKATIPGGAEDLAQVELSFVVSPGATVRTNGEPVVNGVTSLDFTLGDLRELQVTAGGNTASYQILALPAGQDGMGGGPVVERQPVQPAPENTPGTPEDAELADPAGNPMEDIGPNLPLVVGGGVVVLGVLGAAAAALLRRSRPGRE